MKKAKSYRINLKREVKTVRSVNKVTLIGAVGQDPETRFTAAGMAVASFSFATSEKRKDKEEVTQWHSCVCFGKLAEIVQQYVTKGSKLYLDGAIQYQTYQKDDQTRYATKIVVNDLILLSAPSDNGNHSSTQGRQTASGSGKKAAAPQPAQDFDDSEIPF
jgi:single-strand DNA-binding protein